MGGFLTPVMGTKGEESATKECQVDGDPILGSSKNQKRWAAETNNSL